MASSGVIKVQLHLRHCLLFRVFEVDLLQWMCKVLATSGQGLIKNYLGAKWSQAAKTT